MKTEQVKRIIQIILTILGCFLLLLIESGWPTRLRLFGVMPDFSLICTVLLATHYGSKKGSIAGLILGTVHDGLCAGIFFAGPVLCMLIGYICGYVSEQYRGKYFKLVFAEIPILVFAGLFIRLIGDKLLGTGGDLLGSMLYVFLPRMVITAVLALLSIIAYYHIKKHREETKAAEMRAAAVERN